MLVADGNANVNNNEAQIPVQGTEYGKSSKISYGYSDDNIIFIF